MRSRNTTPNSLLELFKSIIPYGVETVLFDESPEAFDEIQVWRIGGANTQALFPVTWQRFVPGNTFDSWHYPG